MLRYTHIASHATIILNPSRDTYQVHLYCGPDASLILIYIRVRRNNVYVEQYYRTSKLINVMLQPNLHLCISNVLHLIDSTNFTSVDVRCDCPYLLQSGYRVL
jgi:hypothetical protein